MSNGILCGTNRWMRIHREKKQVKDKEVLTILSNQHPLYWLVTLNSKDHSFTMIFLLYRGPWTLQSTCSCSATIVKLLTLVVYAGFPESRLPDCLTFYTASIEEWFVKTWTARAHSSNHVVLWHTQTVYNLLFVLNLLMNKDEVRDQESFSAETICQDWLFSWPDSFVRLSTELYEFDLFEYNSIIRSSHQFTAPRPLPNELTLEIVFCHLQQMSSVDPGSMGLFATLHVCGDCSAYKICISQSFNHLIKFFDNGGSILPLAIGAAAASPRTADKKRTTLNCILASVKSDVWDWKKSVVDRHGETLVFMHTLEPFWNHLIRLRSHYRAVRYRLSSTLHSCRYPLQTKLRALQNVTAAGATSKPIVSRLT